VVTGWALEHAVEYRRLLPVRHLRILLVTVLPDLSRAPTVISLCINYGKDSVAQYGGLLLQTGHPVALLVEALRYKLEGRGFDSRWCHWNFSLS